VATSRIVRPAECKPAPSADRSGLPAEALDVARPRCERTAAVRANPAALTVLRVTATSRAEPGHSQVASTAATAGPSSQHSSKLTAS
jgi:hypothetical protein